MKYLLILLFSLTVFCQESNFHNNKDTIYIVLHNAEKQKFDGFTYMSRCANNSCQYIFIESDYKQVVFSTWKNHKTITLRRKRFFKENKSVLYHIHDIEKIGISKFLNTVLKSEGLKKSVIYIINEENMKQKNIVATQAIVAPVGYGDM